MRKIDLEVFEDALIDLSVDLNSIAHAIKYTDYYDEKIPAWIQKRIVAAAKAVDALAEAYEDERKEREDKNSATRLLSPLSSFARRKYSRNARPAPARYVRPREYGRMNARRSARRLTAV